MVQNRGDIGLDKVVMKKERRGEKEKKKRTVCLKKPNLIRPLHTTTYHDTKTPSPRTKAEKAGEKRKEDSDGLGER